MLNFVLDQIRKHPLSWGCFFLVCLTVLNNWPVSYFGFAWDDFGYIVRNYPIQDPVSRKTLWWCLTQFAESNWHPLTWFALNIQFNFFGLDPRGYHLVNLALHVANVALLYCALGRTTGAVGKSLIVAALFAVHPLHVESVAWITEIKDVLSTFFLMLVLHAHISYSRKPTLGRYALTFCALALGLMAKPMLVTAPFALLLLDYWPLGRWNKGPANARTEIPCPRYGVTQLLLEKLPLLVLVAATCVLTFLAQRDGGAVAGLELYPLSTRIANVVNSYVSYLWRMIWPWPLSFYYPYAAIGIFRAFTCSLVLLAISLAAFFTRQNKSYFLFGWLWYLVTLIPVIGFVQVGSQAMADRYTYIPSIGILVISVWISTEILTRLHLNRLFAPIFSLAIIFGHMLVSFEYLGKWTNETDLYLYALGIDDSNIVAHNNYGNVLVTQHRNAEAIKHFKKALQYAPHSDYFLNNLAINLFLTGNKIDALKFIDEAIQHNPRYYGSYVNKAIILASEKDYESSEKLLKFCFNLRQKEYKSVALLASILVEQMRYDEAIILLNNTIPLIYDKDPLKINLLNLIGEIRYKKNELDRAIIAFSDALKLNENDIASLRNMALAAKMKKKYNTALEMIQKAISIAPLNGELKSILADIYYENQQFSKAYLNYRRALALDYNQQNSHEGLAKTLRHYGYINAADIHAVAAEDIRRLRRQNQPSKATKNGTDNLTVLP
jgi:tetratricopeptide (TPR) repeat protein